MIPAFSRHLGVAFQILNDLKDWNGDSDNKLLAGQDALAARPTLLMALAIEGLPPDRLDALKLLLDSAQPTTVTVQKIRDLFQQAGAFEKAEKLVEKYRARAESIADEVEPVELRELLYFLVDTVLDQDLPSAPMLQTLPIVTPLA
jgi:geranylgeranyl pyrophosphate synthase